MRTFVALFLLISGAAAAADRPNILLCISDDQSYESTGANGDPVVRTPAFDRIAAEGLNFTRAFCDAPTCGPSRSALLTGQSIWRLEEAGNIHSTLPAKFATYTERLVAAGYAVGFTGKGWSPGNLEAGGRSANPAGVEFARRKLQPPQKAIANNDYAGNFEAFLDQRSDDRPFCFWLGTFEPHRAYESGAGSRAGLDASKVRVPGQLPDDPVVRQDLVDYLSEVEHFDRMVARAIEMLEARGELDNTLIVVTSDHGMPFPRAKASLYDSGTQVPLAMRWPEGIVHSGRTTDGFVNLSDLAPTFLEVAGLDVPKEMTGRSLRDLLADEPTVTRSAAFTAMERHDGCRAGGKGFPCRAIRTADYLYIHNFEPDRWPSGSPDAADCARAIPYGEIDSSPTKDLMMKRRGESAIADLSELAFGKRSAEELYDVRSDPAQLGNLAGRPEHLKTQTEMRERLFDHLRETRDPRLVGGKVDWDYYPYYGVIHTKGWKVDPKPNDDR